MSSPCYDPLASIAELLQSLSIQPQMSTDNILKKITQIHTELLVKVTKLRNILSSLKEQVPFLQFNDTSDEIIKAIEEMLQVYIPKPDDISVLVMPKKLRGGEECRVTVCVYDQKKRIYQGPVNVHVQEAMKPGTVREGTHKFICHTDAILDNRLHIVAGDRTFEKHIQFGG